MNNYFGSAHSLAQVLLGGPDYDVYYCENKDDNLVRVWERPEVRRVSYLYNDETDNVIILKGDPDW